jgi:hypothetical protein
MSKAQGGGDREWLRPLRGDGNLNHDISGTEIIGNHKGAYSGLNIANPAPGLYHQWERNNPRDIFSAQQRGFWVADPERDGSPAYKLADFGHDRPTPLDTADVFGDVIHMVTSEDNYRRLLNEQAEENRRKMGQSDVGFLEGASPEEAATASGGRSRNRAVATRWATREHSTALMEGETVRDTVAPRGIVREDY